MNSGAAPFTKPPPYLSAHWLPVVTSEHLIGGERGQVSTRPTDRLTWKEEREASGRQKDYEA
ncbi:hypothetical protein EYF80_016986 [Liparis tanakae]|uniref:Uncharacterized protein n=1 Tax=Liparis tanakae TaxID=230148 RepID=A0A4Z2I5Y6_9TELE|nr:hypothetical protein EYF80_016986 [Liparis tanakae]